MTFVDLCQAEECREGEGRWPVTQKAGADMGWMPNRNFARRGHASVAELVDARDSNGVLTRSVGSIPSWLRIEINACVQ